MESARERRKPKFTSPPSRSPGGLEASRDEARGPARGPPPRSNLSFWPEQVRTLKRGRSSSESPLQRFAIRFGRWSSGFQFDRSNAARCACPRLIVDPNRRQPCWLGLLRSGLPPWTHTLSRRPAASVRVALWRRSRLRPPGCTEAIGRTEHYRQTRHDRPDERNRATGRLS
jgi:hypothetical protein